MKYCANIYTNINMKHFSIDLDFFSETVHEFLASNQDGGAGHFARFTTETKEEAAKRASKLIEKHLLDVMYESDDYGYKLD